MKLKQVLLVVWVAPQLLGRQPGNRSYCELQKRVQASAVADLVQQRLMRGLHTVWHEGELSASEL